jgi:FdhE protein
VPNFLQRWFGGRPEPPKHLASAFDELDKLARARPTLASSCQALQAILPELFGESPGAQAPLPLLESARSKLAEGIPLLRDVPLIIDEDALRRRALAVCAAVDQKDAETLTDELCKKTWAPAALLKEVLAGRPETVSAQAESLGLDAELLATVLRLAALPALAPIASAAAEVRHGIAWDHGYCPTCGSWPLLAESRGLEQMRFLRCGWCACAWEGSRLRCAFCGNQDHRTLGYFHVEGEEDRMRAATCDECRGYVKVVATLFALAAPQLLVADLSTLHMDLVAAERGYFIPEIE